MTKLKTLPYTDYPNVAKALSEVVWSSYHARQSVFNDDSEN